MTFAAIQGARVRIPSSWSVMPFKRVAALREDPDSTAEATLLSLKNTGELVPRADDVQPPSAEHRLRYWHVDPGDLVVNPMWLAGGAIGVGLVSGAVSPDYRVYSLSARVEPRFIHHLLRSVPYRDQYRLLMRAETTFDRRVTKEDFAELPVLVPPLHVQRAIVDLLDAETARIDALIEKKQRMIILIAERARTIADQTIWSEVDAEIPLMYVVQPQRPVMYGIVLPGPDVGERGVPIVKGGDVATDLSLKRLARTTAEIERPYARARLKSGDLLFAIRGGVGEAAIVPPELEGASITQDVARVAPADDIPAEWLLHVVRSRTFQRRAAELVRGATITGLNIRDLERIRIPRSDRERQAADLAGLRPLAAVSAALSQRLERQIVLLREHRQALITGAVTGELDTAKVAA